jgi:hypothetical protein
MASKYDRLGDHLAAIGAATIALTFAEVEAVVGPLPASARLPRNVSWWGATARGRYGHAHTLYWWRAGYVADRPDFAAGTVTFRRVGP